MPFIGDTIFNKIQMAYDPLKENKNIKIVLFIDYLLFSTHYIDTNLITYIIFFDIKLIFGNCILETCMCLIKPIHIK